MMTPRNPCRMHFTKVVTRTLTLTAILWLGDSPVIGIENDPRRTVTAPETAEETIRSAVIPDASGQAKLEEEAKAAAAPVPVPPLSHYAALWERSMFTTHDLPAPEVPQGPGFADQLVLAGMYEVDGAVVAVILDKMTASVSEARFGSDNEQGLRIKAVEEAAGASGTRVQLQKGMQSGWVTFAEIPTTQPAGATAAGGNASGTLAPRPLVPGAATGEQPSAAPGVPGSAASILSQLSAPGTPTVAPPAATAPAATPQSGVSPPNASGPNPVLDEIPLPPP